MRNHLCILSYSVVSDLCDPVDCSPPGSSLRGIVPVSPSKNTGVGYYFFLQGIFLPRGQTSSPASPALQADSLPLNDWGSH